MWAMKERQNSVTQGHENITLFAKDVHFKGIVKFDGTVRVDGHVEGEIHTTGMLIVGETAVIKAWYRPAS